MSNNTFRLLCSKNDARVEKGIVLDIYIDDLVNRALFSQDKDVVANELWRLMQSNVDLYEIFYMAVEKYEMINGSSPN